MFCTTVIATIGRTTLSRAVESVLEQGLGASDHEVIVVNDSGSPLKQVDWLDPDRVRVIDTPRRERCVARNAGASVARGDYLHFLDDDDWLIPGALSKFRETAEAKGHAAWLYGSTQLVDRNGTPIIQLHHGIRGNCLVQAMAGEWIPLQASLIRAEQFFVAGGFNHRSVGSEDVDLCRRVALRGEFAEVPAVVACITMGEASSTTDYIGSARLARAAREEVLDASGSFTRMVNSAASNEWCGRVVRIYLTSAAHNMQQKKLFTAVSRAVHALVGLVFAGPRSLSWPFWQAVATSYESSTFVSAFQALGKPVLRRSRGN